MEEAINMPWDVYMVRVQNEAINEAGMTNDDDKWSWHMSISEIDGSASADLSYRINLSKKRTQKMSHS